MVLRRCCVALVIMYASTSAPQPAACEVWCTEPCTVLNGNVQFECNSCDPKNGAQCYPGAAGYDNWEARASQYKEQAGDKARQPNVELPPEDDFPGCDTLRCRRVREKRKLAVAEARKKPPPRG